MSWTTHTLGVLFLSALAVLAQLPGAQLAPETQIAARARLFPDLVAGDPPRPVGPRALARDSAGRFYLLFPQLPGVRGSVIYVYSGEGKRAGQIPVMGASKEASIAFATDFAIAPDGRVFVSDSGAGAVKTFTHEGSLVNSFPVAAPASIVALKDGEVAVTSLRSEKLVAVFNSRGQFVREFGEPTEIAGREALNRYLNLGRIAADGASNLYLAFSYVPEPTLRKYDAFGYLAFESELSTLDFQPTAQAARRTLADIVSRGDNTPRLRPIVNALAVDQATGETWAAVGPLLIHFDRNGDRRATFRPFTPEGFRVEASAIFLEADRILLATESLGVFEFARPDKPAPAAPRPATSPSN